MWIVSWEKWAEAIRLSHQGVNSKLSLEMTIFVDAKRNIEKTSLVLQKQGMFFGDCSQGCNSMKVLVYKNKHKIMSTSLWPSTGHSRKSKVSAHRHQFTSSAQEAVSFLFNPLKAARTSGFVSKSTWIYTRQSISSVYKQIRVTKLLDSTLLGSGDWLLTVMCDKQQTVIL